MNDRTMTFSIGDQTEQEIRNILKTLGFTDRTTLSYASSGNWIVEKIG